MSSIFHNPAAMSPFFDDVIIVKGVRASASQTSQTPICGTFRACVFDNGFADPIASADAESNVRTFTIITPAGEWLERNPPQVGDTVAMDGRPPLRVARIDSLDGDEWVMTAKEVA